MSLSFIMSVTVFFINEIEAEILLTVVLVEEAAMVTEVLDFNKDQMFVLVAVVPIHLVMVFTNKTVQNVGVDTQNNELQIGIVIHY